MTANNNTLRWTIDQQSIITPYRKFQPKRNVSAPDINQIFKPINKSPEKCKLKYNKWFIKPQKRMQKAIITESNEDQSLPLSCRLSQDYFYQSLYNHKGRLTVLKKANQVNKICSDGQNIKLLSIFKKNIESGTYIKRENIKRRIPGLINYILNCSQQEEKQRQIHIIKKHKLL